MTPCNIVHPAPGGGSMVQKLDSGGAAAVTRTQFLSARVRATRERNAGRAVQRVAQRSTGNAPRDAFPSRAKSRS